MAKKENFFKKYKSIILSILFTLLCLFVWRFASHLQLPLLNYKPQPSGDDNIFGFLDMFSGGALSSFSIVALGISPYITASIVVQLLQMDIIPQFKEWSEEGEAGKEKLNRWTRYIALFLAFVQGLALIIGYEAQYGTTYFKYIQDAEYNIFTYVYIAIVITAGTAFVLWLADQITMKGIGNGSSLLIVAGIVASFPTMFDAMWKFFITGEYSNYYWNEANKAGGATNAWGIILYILMVVFFILIVVGVIWMEGLVRKIPIQYSNRPAAAKLVGNQDSNMPIKLNSASVIPVIFASTLMSLPATIIQITQVNTTSGIGKWLSQIFLTTSTDATTGNVTINVMGFLLYIMLIVVFSFFYSFLQLNPEKMSENLQKQNAYVPGVRPGEETTGYISRVLFKMTVVGATYLTIVAILPIVMTVIFDLPASAQIGGTSLIIVVGVAIESWKQLKQAKQEKQYRGFID